MFINPLLPNQQPFPNDRSRQWSLQWNQPGKVDHSANLDDNIDCVISPVLLKAVGFAFTFARAWDSIFSDGRLFASLAERSS
jgi:hypothetical protein